MFCNAQFRKNSQIGLLFRKFRKFLAMGSLLMLAQASHLEPWYT